jgi:hypothetical protein
MKTDSTATMDVATRDARKERLLHEFAALQSFCRGRLHEVYKTCGKQGCLCATDTARRHGPYFSWVRPDGTQRTLRPEEAAHVREGIARHGEYEKIRAAYEETMEAEHQAAFQVAQGSAAVKKTPARPLASSGTRRTTGKRRARRRAHATRMRCGGRRPRSH